MLNQRILLAAKNHAARITNSGEKVAQEQGSPSRYTEVRFAMTQRPRILIIGLCALPMGTMERQLGNMAIFIPMIKTLKNESPNAHISTSLQLSENFCRHYGIASLKYRSLYEPRVRSGVISLLDYIRTCTWHYFTKHLKLNMKFLITGKKLREFIDADVILDFSGDTYGDMGHPVHLLKHSLDILTAVVLEKPVYMFAQSPGPFSTKFRSFVAKKVLNKVALISVREPMAYETLQQAGIKAPVIMTACPAFLFERAPAAKVKQILLSEGISRKDRPLVGMTITGFNVSRELISEDKYKESREESELGPLVAVLEYLLQKLKVNVLLIPHVFRTDKFGKLIAGPDTKITEQLCQMVNGGECKYGDKLKVLKGIYGPSETKGIIGQCDLFIGGRLHAGVSALSQNIPTVLLGYGLKHYGFARLVGQERYVSNNFGGKINAQDIISKIEDAWNNRENISSEIRSRMPKVRQLALLNATIVKEIIDLPRNRSRAIPPQIVDSWIERAEQDSVGPYFDAVMAKLDEIPGPQ